MSWCVRLPRHKWPKSQTNIEDPDRNLVIHHPDCCVKDSSEKFHCDLDWKKYRIGNVAKDDSCQYPWMTSEWLENSRIRLPWDDEKRWSLTSQFRFLINVNVNRPKFLLRSNRKIVKRGRNITQKLSRGFTIWKDMRKSTLRGIVS